MDIHEHEPDEQSDKNGHDDLSNDIAFLARSCLLGRLIGSFNGLYNGADASHHPARHISDAKSWGDFISNDLRRSGIGQYAFQTVPDFNADLALLNRHQQQDAVVGALVTEFPRRRNTMREFFERFAVEGRNDQNRHLIA